MEWTIIAILVVRVRKYDFIFLYSGDEDRRYRTHYRGWFPLNISTLQFQIKHTVYRKQIQKYILSCVLWHS